MATGVRTHSPTEDLVQEFIERELRPRVQVDGGDVVFAGLDGDAGRVTVRLRGDCSRCPAAPGRLTGWIARRLRREFGRDFEVVPVFEKPYFYR
jgi:NifU-like protein